MFDPQKQANEDISKARTREQVDAVIKREYFAQMGEKTGNDLFEYHLAKLETATSHLAIMSRVAIDLVTVEDTNLATAVGICASMIDQMIDRLDVQHSKEIRRIWSLLRELLAGIRSYDGEHEPLDRSIWLAHLTAKIILELWRSSISGNEHNSMYFPPEEDDFAKGLPWPILTTVPFAKQVGALVANLSSTEMPQPLHRVPLRKLDNFSRIRGWLFGK